METIFVRKPSNEQKKLLESQPTWEHEKDTWYAEYDERCETFLVVEGQGSITLPDGTKYTFVAGDLVTCTPRIKCTWNVQEYIKKHYIFDMEI